MENASKALIIAGAILISILLISVGIMIFNGSSGLFSSATAKMSDQEKTMFNQTFTMYNGTRVSGTSVSELVRAVIANNKDEETNPEVQINGSKPNTEADVTPSGEAIKRAYQYTVQTEDNNNDGVVDNIRIEKTGA